MASKKSVTALNTQIGGGAKVSVQSMLNKPASDIVGSVQQAKELEAAGCVFLASGGWYHGEYETSAYELTSRTDCTVSRNDGGWYFDNVLYQDNLNTSLRVYTYSGGNLEYYWGSWTNSSTACWDWRFSIRLIRDDGTFIHDYNKDDPENW